MTDRDESAVARLVRERANRFGPIPFEDFVELALYAPAVGFYESGGAAGSDAQSGDFLTSPSLGGLFGAVLARAFDTWWDSLGRPDPFVVVEAAAGAGLLCKSVLDAAPRCASALRYLLVERSAALRARHGMRLPVEPAAHVLGPVAPGDEDDDAGTQPLPGGGPRLASLPDLPAGPVVGVVVANELLDNLAFGLVERDSDRWREVRVSGDLDEVLVPAAPALAAHVERLVPDARPGDRVPVQRRAGAWLWNALRVIERGRVVIVDYAVTATAELAERPQHEWLRTYRHGAPGGHPLTRPGSQDITVEVCLDQLGLVSAPSSVRSQHDFLREHGIDEIVRDAQREWREGSAGGSLAALRARSRISEADALTDLAGLGSHRVVEWIL